jgi:hypothetical protein
LNIKSSMETQNNKCTDESLRYIAANYQSKVTETMNSQYHGQKSYKNQRQNMLVCVYMCVYIYASVFSLFRAV